MFLGRCVRVSLKNACTVNILQEKSAFIFVCVLNKCILFGYLFCFELEKERKIISLLRIREEKTKRDSNKELKTEIKQCCVHFIFFVFRFVAFVRLCLQLAKIPAAAAAAPLPLRLALYEIAFSSGNASNWAPINFTVVVNFVLQKKRTTITLAAAAAAAAENRQLVSCVLIIVLCFDVLGCGCFVRFAFFNARHSGVFMCEFRLSARFLLSFQRLGVSILPFSTENRLFAIVITEQERTNRSKRCVRWWCLWWFPVKLDRFQ